MLNKNNNTQPQAIGNLIGLSLVFELGYMIALPIVICALGGRLMDRHWGTSPLFLLVGIGIAMVVSGYMVYTKMQSIGVTDQQSPAKKAEDRKDYTHQKL